MKSIRRHRLFVKNFRSRVSNNPKLTKQFEKRLLLFLNGERGYPLNDHVLIGTKKGLRSFSVAGDVRVVYRETVEHYEFLDIGTHNQVY
jgi:mRNA interferase YafQ